MVSLTWPTVLLAFTTYLLLTVKLTSSQSFNPSILQDSRDLPKTDGTFGFLYRTEDGIAHAAKGDSNGQIHGRFSYTDPTGLKVNYNYNAGSRVTPGYTYEDAPTRPPPRYQQTEPSYQHYQPPPPPPPPRPLPSQNVDYTPKYSARYRQQDYNDGGEVYQRRRSRPLYRNNNEVNDYYYY